MHCRQGRAATVDAARPPRHKHDARLAAAVAIGRGVKGLAAAVGRKRAKLCQVDAGAGHKHEVGASTHCRAGLSIQQAPVPQVGGHQGGGAGGVHADAGACRGGRQQRRGGEQHPAAGAGGSSCGAPAWLTPPTLEAKGVRDAAHCEVEAAAGEGGDSGLDRHVVLQDLRAGRGAAVCAHDKKGKVQRRRACRTGARVRCIYTASRAASAVPGTRSRRSPSTRRCSQTRCPAQGAGRARQALSLSISWHWPARSSARAGRC